MKITVVGLGYVGLANAILLAQNDTVVALDINAEKVSKINKRISPLVDNKIQDYLLRPNLKLSATLSSEVAYRDSSYVIIATPTNFNPINNYFDTSEIEKIIVNITCINPQAIIIIKSTIPIGFINKVITKYNINQVLFSPEFLREGQALHDVLNPSRIVIGENSLRAKKFAKILLKGSNIIDVPILYTSSDEAAAIKLFANSYLAMRVAFFNELDSYTLSKDLDTAKVINGMCTDPRISTGYNNPSFGYGGYCLPKDTKQLLSNYDKIPQKLIRAIVESNTSRQDFIVEKILQTKPKTVGVYKLEMKKGSDNIRKSSVLGIIDRIKHEKINLLIYEPLLKDETYKGIQVIKNLDVFKEQSEVIIANRISNDITNVIDKVFTRDLFGDG